MILIRLLEKSDIDEIVTLEEICFPEDPWSRQSFETELDNPLSVFFVAKDEETGKMMGYGGVWLMYDVADITNIAVHPDYRQEGIGRKLLNLLIQIAKENKMSAITLEVRESNLPAQKMYESAGFVHCGTRKRYYQGREDAKIMTLEFPVLEEKYMKILAIESSCDETAAAVVEDGTKVLSNVINTQIELHKLYGGVVPEIASRKHIENVSAVVDKALSDSNCSLEEIDAIAVTYGPGLVGALLVGVSTAKGLSFAAKKPLIPVHHIKGHISANYIENPDFKPPFLCLVASGGHSHLVLVEDYDQYRILARTRDDAAGEAFDKVSRVLGLGYPGGPAIQKAAEAGNPNAIRFPRVNMGEDGLDFSFSGVKTAVLNYLHNTEQKGEEINVADVAASFQEAVIDVLTEHLISCAKDCKVEKIALAGGVAANGPLRERIDKRAKEEGFVFQYPKFSLCTDNAAMIGCAAYYSYQNGKVADMTLNAVPNLSLEDEI